MNWGAFKPLLAEAVVAHLEPIQVPTHPTSSFSSSSTTYVLRTNHEHPPTFPPTHPPTLQNKYKEVMADPEVIEGVLAKGAADADAIAGQTLQWAKDAMGFYSLGRK